MDIDKTINILSRGTVEIINIEGLKKKLEKSYKMKRPLRIKAGFDPTAPDIHLGHVVLLRKIRQFQDLGHKVFFLIGDFTAQVGDPTGRDQTRPKLDRQGIQENAQTYKDQVYKILDLEKTEVVFNSSWLGQLSSQALLELTMHSSVAQMLARADFKKRYDDGKEISLLEFVYPLLQGYDSVYLNADVELGGSDQKFNLLMGRQIQEAYQQEPQIVLMTPLLEGTDGVNKMSKSLNNYIGINEPPAEIFGKVMSISDELMLRYAEYLTDFDLKQFKAQHPKEAKAALAKEIVRQFYDKDEAQKAFEGFEKVFSQNKVPEDIVEISVEEETVDGLANCLTEQKIVPSKKEFRRLLAQGAVSIDGEKIDESWPFKKGIIKIGKRRFVRIT